MSNPTLAEFEQAAAFLADVITATPIDESEHLTGVLGQPVYLKLENMQRTGSFKIRGAAYRLSQLTAEERARGVVAASAGNHAQGVARAAHQLGIPATIFMPLGVPVPKLLATRSYGADVVLEGPTVETPLRLAAEFAERTGAVLIHPYDHRDVIIGQGTLGLEVFDAVPEVETVLVGIGGGGLIAGDRGRRRPDAGRHRVGPAHPRRRRGSRQGAGSGRRTRRPRHRCAGGELRGLPVVAAGGRARHR